MAAAQNPSVQPFVKCTVCRHPERQAIDFAMANGGVNFNLAEQYKLGRESVNRHRKNCLMTNLARANANKARRVVQQEVKRQAADIIAEADSTRKVPYISHATILEKLFQLEELTWDELL